MPVVTIRAPASGIWRVALEPVAEGDTAIAVRQRLSGAVSEPSAAVVRRAAGPAPRPWLLAGGVWSNAGAWRNDAIWTN